MDEGEAKPLLTIAIPTYNRSGDLGTLLGVLQPQLQGRPEVDLYVSDNASPDDTEAVVAGFAARGMAIRYVRQAENIGSDRNFVECFEEARGRYFWLCGDDDVILPGTIDKVLGHIGGGQVVDLIYLSNYGFREDYIAERREDPLRRRVHTFTDAREFAKVVNIMFTFTSAMIVNRDRLMELPHEEPRAFLSTNLTQLSWVLPLLREHRRSVVLWDRPLAARTGNSGGYALGRVFGKGLRNTVCRLLPGRGDLQACILNFTLRRWLPSVMVSMRAAENERLGLETAERDFRAAYRGNFRYWVFAYPVMRLPLGLAKVWLKAGAAVSLGIYAVTVPGFWRKQR